MLCRGPYARAPTRVLTGNNVSICNNGTEFTFFGVFPEVTERSVRIGKENKGSYGNCLFLEIFATIFGVVVCWFILTAFFYRDIERH